MSPKSSIKSTLSYDCITYSLDKEKKIVKNFKIEILDKINYHQQIINSFIDEMKKNKIKWIELYFPHNGKHKVQKKVDEILNKETGEIQNVFETIMEYNNMPSGMELNIKDMGTITTNKFLGYRHILVPLESFPLFYSLNLKRLIQNVETKFKEAEIEVDDEGFTLVKNIKKIKRESKKKLYSTITEMQHNATSIYYEETENNDSDDYDESTQHLYNDNEVYNEDINGLRDEEML